jgi:Arc/MetJ-type ribon-helix-helix transcriptional regulator
MSCFTINIPLSPELVDFVEEQVKRRGFASPSEYMEALVLQDRFSPLPQVDDA